MDVVFADGDLDRLETDPAFAMGLPAPVVSAYRKRLQAVRAAADERDLRAVPSWRFEKLQGKRCHQHSMRLNDQYRLVLTLGVGPAGKRIRVVGVEDYH